MIPDSTPPVLSPESLPGGFGGGGFTVVPGAVGVVDGGARLEDVGTVVGTVDDEGATVVETTVETVVDAGGNVVTDEGTVVDTGTVVEGATVVDDGLTVVTVT